MTTANEGLSRARLAELLHYATRKSGADWCGTWFIGTIFSVITACIVFGVAAFNFGIGATIAVFWITLLCGVYVTYRSSHIVTFTARRLKALTSLQREALVEALAREVGWPNIQVAVAYSLLCDGDLLAAVIANPHGFLNAV